MSRAATSSVLILFVALGCGTKTESSEEARPGATQTAAESESVPPVATPPEGMVTIEGGVLDGEVVDTFYLDRTEVTVAAYRECVEAGGCQGIGFPEGNYALGDRENHPINYANAYTADAYCTWAGKRLPTVREWVWAASGRGEDRTYPWGEEPPTLELAAMAPEFEEPPGDDEPPQTTSPVAARPKGASRDGVLDMSGNVMEWTSTTRGNGRPLCGGAWNNGNAEYLQASRCLRSSGGSREEVADSLAGFRCASPPAQSGQRR